MEAREEAQAKPLLRCPRFLIVFTRFRESFWQRHQLECVGHKRRSKAARLVEEHIGVVQREMVDANAWQRRHSRCLTFLEAVVFHEEVNLTRSQRRCCAKRWLETWLVDRSFNSWSLRSGGGWMEWHHVRKDAQNIAKGSAEDGGGGGG
jgi:hypothetical protein